LNNTRADHSKGCLHWYSCCRRAQQHTRCCLCRTYYVSRLPPRLLIFQIHDSTYSIDFAIISIGESNQNSDDSSAEDSGANTPSTASQRAALLADEVIARICDYRDDHLYKFVGAGLTPSVVEACPQLPSRLWLELDIVPLVLEPHSGVDNSSTPGAPKYRLVDEEADAVVRKAFG
jgi:hypothetical protein